MAEFDVKKAITDLGDTEWSKTEEERGKAVSLIKGLMFATEESDVAKKFIIDLDKATTTIAKKIAGVPAEKKDESKTKVDESIGEDHDIELANRALL